MPPLNLLQREEIWINSGGTPTDAFAEVIEDIVKELSEMTPNIQLFKIAPASSSPSVDGEYTSDTTVNKGRGTVITQFVAIGTGTFDVYIGDAATVPNQIISGGAASAVGVSVEALVNQLINPGESVWVVPSVASAIVFMASGTQRT